MKLGVLLLGIVIGVSAGACGDNIDGPTDDNGAPTLADSSVTTNEDTPVSVTVSATDADGDALTFSFSDPAHGAVAQTGSTIIYTPDENYNGPDSVTVTVSDGDATSTATISITVTPVNDAPVAGDDAIASNEDAVSSIAATTLLANDSDLDGDTLTITTVGTASQGTATLSGTTVTYTPPANFVGAATFDYTISDGTATATATVTVTVGGENDPPVAVDDNVTIDEDAVTMIAIATLLANDTDAEGQTLSLTAVSNPTGGTAVLNGSDVTFTPTPNFTGTAGFDYTVSDGAATDTGHVTITVTPQNDAPTAVAGTATTNEDMPVVITLTGTDVEGTALTFAIATPPTAGTLGAITQVTATTATVTYTPAANSSADDSFSFTVSDGALTSAPATVTIDVVPQSDVPVAISGTAQTNEDTSVVITLAGSDGDGDALTFSIVTGPTAGTLGAITQVTATTATVTYTPAANSAVDDSFTFRVNDGTSNSAPATVAIDVVPQPDPPVAVARTAQTNEDTAVTITLSGTDPDGNALTFSVVTGPSAGTLGAITQLTPTTASITYTPALNSTVDDSFTFRVNDGTTNSAPATVTIDVVPQNDAPVAVAGTTQVNEDSSVVITLSGTDADNNALTFSVVAGPTAGTLGAITQVTPTTATVTYTPAANSTVDDSFTFRVNDGTTNSAAATVTIDVVPQNDAPVATARTAQTNEDTAVVITLADTDIDGNALTFSIVTGPTAGTLGAITQLTPTTASVTYTPAANSTVDDSFTFRVNDGTANSLAATVSIDVVPQNDIPVAIASTTQTNEDTAMVVTLAGSDADGDALTFSIVTGPTAGTLGAITQVTPTTATVTYTPALNSDADDSFTFRVNDGTVNSVAATATIDVVPQNDPPVAVDDGDSVERDGTLVRAGSVYTANDTDVDASTTLSVIAVGNAINGTVSLTGGVITFTPTSGFSGTAGFEYTVSDGAASDVGNVTVTVIDNNTPVVAVDDTDTVGEDDALVRQASVYLANDIDPDPQTLTITAVHSAVNGTVSLVGTTITFTPTADYSGSASFSYDVTDGLSTDTGLVTVTVNAVNDDPIAVDDSATVNEDDNVLVSVLANDTNDDGPPTIQSFTQGTNGTVALVTGQLRYTPSANFNGSDSFTYTIVDNGALTDTATVSVTVTPVNDTPVAVDQTTSTNEDTSVTITLTGTDVDASTTLTFAIAEPPTDGTLGAITQVTATSATVVYTPDADFVGDDIFSFTVNDGTATSAEGLVLVEVQNVVVCGDGFVEGTEACDDGGTAPGDGCSATCTEEQGWDCTGTPSVCDTICGDNFVVAGQEECDDMNSVETDGCTTQCERGVVCAATNSVLAAGDRFATDPGNATCYVSFDDDMTTWFDAQTACVAVGGNLASITSAGEQNIVASVHNTAQNPWIGAADEIVEGSFGWVTGESLTYTNWAPGQPDGGDPEDCVNLFASSIAPNSQWNDTSCTFTGFVQGRICEIPPPVCGNGKLEAVGGEACDDGNTNAYDGCSATCTVEAGAQCSGTAPTTCAKVVINEIEYDNAGTDSSEYIEIYNAGTATANLTNHAVVLANGSTTVGAQYARVNLTGTLAPGAYAMICPSTSATGNCGTYALPAGTARFLLPGATDQIQNGSPDALGLFIISGTTATPVDVVSYEGTTATGQITGISGTSPFAEGTGIAIANSEDNVNNISLQRTPNGRDTQSNTADFKLAAPTPGAATAPL